jgi:hypothetical protein
VVWVTTVVTALLLVALAWRFLYRRRARRPAWPLPPKNVAGAHRVGRVWTDHDPLLAVDAQAANAWTGIEGHYAGISDSHVELGSLTAMVLTPEVDEGPVDVFELSGGDLLLVSVTAADADDWSEFLAAVARTPTRQIGRIEVPSGTLALFHAAAPRASLAVVEPSGAGGMPFADEPLALPVAPGSYEVLESAIDARSYALLAWRLRRADV